MSVARICVSMDAAVPASPTKSAGQNWGRPDAIGSKENLV